MTEGMQPLLLGAGQLAFLVAGAPLLQGIVRKLKARLQSRSGPPLLQSYYDLLKLFSRSEMVADTSSVVGAAAPVVVATAMLTAALFIPMFAAAAPVTRDGDLLIVIGIFALARAALTLGGMDSGSSFGQMGSSRELAVGALVEPALLLSLVVLALAAETTRLGEIAAAGVNDGFGFINLQWALALLGFSIVAVAETGRIPVDNPDTHLELTMIHEAMLIEYSGRSLGVLHLSAMAKQLVLGCMIADLFFPFGLHVDPSAGDYLIGAALLAGKLAIVGVGLAVLESAFAKMRLYELPDFIGSAALAGMVAVAITVWQV